jgi:hypothetical protein
MDRAVSRRHVFYLSGFDPRGARHYHQLYKSESAKQASVNGLDLAVGARRKVAPHIHGWRIDGAGVHTEIEFLAWDDVIRAHWHSGIPAVCRWLWDFFFVIVGKGVIPKTARVSRTQLIAGFYPVVFLGAAAALAVAAFLAVLHLAAPVWTFLPALAAAFGVFRALIWLGDRMAVFWLLRIYSFSALWGQKDIPALQDRMDAFAARIARVLKESPAEEVMIAAHSVGTMIAVPVMARVLKMLREDPAAVGQGRVCIVTLGHCIPLLSFQREASPFRADLETVAADRRILWADYTAPTDGATFPLLDFVRTSGIALEAGAGPVYLSPRFFRLYRPENYRRLRYSWYTMHFLYLMATDHAGDYDYFAMTAGPAPLSARLAGGGR